jgi:hypothetical protein
MDYATPEQERKSLSGFNDWPAAIRETWRLSAAASARCGSTTGPGYRAYYRQKGDTVTFLLGGDKGSQKTDIARAKTIADNLEE